MVPDWSSALAEGHCDVKNQAAEAKSMYGLALSKSTTTFPPAEVVASFEAIPGIDSAYLRLKAADCMFRVPFPGVGLTGLLYLKSPDSNAIVLIKAAISPGEVMP